MTTERLRRVCIFCGEPNVSKEHLWPRWLTKKYPDNRPNLGHQLHKIRLLADRADVTEEVGMLARRGPPASQKIRRVCETCNNGWMSNLQNSAKPILKPLIEGNWSLPANDACGILAAWVAMTTSVIEFADETTVAIPTQDRHYIRQEGRLPPRWSIWIGKYEGQKHHHSFWHRAFGLPTTAAPPDHYNGQLTILIVGKLLVLAGSVSENALNSLLYMAGHDNLMLVEYCSPRYDGGVERFYPAQQMTSGAFDEEAAENLMDYFYSMLFQLHYS